MTQNLRLTCTLAIGLLGGTILSHYVSPISVFAQSLVAPTERVALVTGLGTKLGDFDPTQGTIKLIPIVKFQIQKTDRTVTLQLSPGSDSK
jgi:hypothetical protein